MTEMSKKEDEIFRQKNIRYRIKRASERLVSFIQVFIALAGLAIAILLNVPWLEGPLRRIGLTSTGALTGSVITVIVVSIFFDVRTLTVGKTGPEKRHFSDPMDVYPVLLERIKSISRAEEKVLDVIGMTLYTAWPSIKFWLNRNDLNGWTVRFAAVSSGGQRRSTHVPVAWHREAKTNLDNICDFANSPVAQAKHINLQSFGYDFMPVLHGYRLGNGDLFYSILMWQDNGTIGIDNYSYEFVPREDKSPSADAIRVVFDSWFRRASVTRWVAKRQ
jgi:hypothetical protein